MTIDFLDVQGAAASDIDWPDVYFSPGYGAAVETSDGGRWEVAVGAAGRILSPYLLRPVPASLTGGEELWDAVSPYGYAGTYVAPSVIDEDLRRFRADLRSAQAARGVVAEFQRLGSLVPGAEALLRCDADADGQRHNDTVEVDLSDGYDAFWTGAKGRHRTSVRKARRSGLRWEECPASSTELLEGGAFRNLYDSTMERVQAKPYYFFEDAYYERLLDALGDDLRLARVFDQDGQTSAAALFMRWGERLHYHLAGSRPDAARAGANNLLIDSMIGWATEAGLRRLHLGGGLTADDALFRFKTQFGGERLPFHLLRTVLDPQRVATLTERRALETDRSPDDLRRSGFFPPYRA